MTGNTTAAPFPLTQGKGAAVAHCTVIAALCQDDGCCITCRDCGHIFVVSKPLSDESVEADNLQLARDLWYHDCHSEGRVAREIERRARSNRR